MTAPDWTVLRTPDWMDSAACASVDPTLFFPDKGGSALGAMKVCRHCPVARICLAYALETDQRHGIWGGVVQQDLRKLTKKKRRGVTS